MCALGRRFGGVRLSSGLHSLASVLVVLSVAACGGGGGGLVTTTGTVSGLVTNLDNNSPVAGAAVSRSSGSPSTTTGSDGRYTLANVPSGQQTLVASGSGLQSVQRTVSVPSQGTATLNFGLTKFPDPAIIGPSNYQGGMATVNIVGASAIYVATIAPKSTDGGSYTLQAIGLSFMQTAPTTRVTPSAAVATALTFHTKLRELGQQLAMRAPRASAVPKAQVQTVTVGSQGTFWVVVGGSLTNQQQTSATLQASSTHGLLYVDNADLASMSSAQAASVLQTWEAQIYSTDTSVFGLPQNTYNSNGQGQITILITHLVQGPLSGGTIIGYFFPCDLYADGTCGNLHSNQADIIYLNANLNDALLKGDMAHEFQHLINYSQHVFVFGSAAETTWIDEGLAMLAEDLVGYGYQAGSSSNTVGVAQAFLAAPSAISLWNFSSTVANYGAAWLLFRYLADRFGNQIAGRLVQTAQTGSTNLETQTGEASGQILSEEAMAILNTTFNLGLPSPYTYTSINAATLGTTPAFTSSGSATLNSGGYRFYGFNSSLFPAAQISLQAGSAIPWAGAGH